MEHPLRLLRAFIFQSADREQLRLQHGPDRAARRLIAGRAVECVHERIHERDRVVAVLALLRNPRDQREQQLLDGIDIRRPALPAGKELTQRHMEMLGILRRQALLEPLRERLLLLRVRLRRPCGREPHHDALAQHQILLVCMEQVPHLALELLPGNGPVGQQQERRRAAVAFPGRDRRRALLEPVRRVGLPDAEQDQKAVLINAHLQLRVLFQRQKRPAAEDQLVLIVHARGHQHMIIRRGQRQRLFQRLLTLLVEAVEIFLAAFLAEVGELVVQMQQRDGQLVLADGLEDIVRHVQPDSIARVFKRIVAADNNRAQLRQARLKLPQQLETRQPAHFDVRHQYVQIRERLQRQQLLRAFADGGDVEQVRRLYNALDIPRGMRLILDDCQLILSHFTFLPSFRRAARFQSRPLHCLRSGSQNCLQKTH